ncbi:MAG TPA: Gfo/Idh/MocA family oxidoreductase [Tepidisphaeraceae bacterium]|nr:Gfo/Idh/MocA family oxidoreductase [Tepidisphaeraceae bacterium]
MSNPIRVGIAGLGRSGWSIHARSLLAMPQKYTLVAVADSAAERRDEAAATAQCRACATFDELIADPNVELLVVATPSHLHPEHSIAAMRAGKHVVCEKPLALNVEQADRMIAVAEQTGRVLAPFHNRRYESHLRKVQQILACGLLGQIVQVRMAWHGFGRRWDWQTLKEFGGGSLNNNGSHLLDQALQIFGDGEPHVFADIRHTPLSSGDADDHVKVILYAPGHPTIDCELTSAAAYPQERWHVMGTSGGLHGTTDKLHWKWVDWKSMPPRPVQRGPTPDRAYNSEKLIWHEDSWTHTPDGPTITDQFYFDLFETIRHSRPLFITPASVRRLIRVIEQCRCAARTQDI